MLAVIVCLFVVVVVVVCVYVCVFVIVVVNPNPNPNLVAQVVGVVVLILGRRRRLGRAHLVPPAEAPLLAAGARLVDVAPGAARPRQGPGLVRVGVKTG